MAHHIVFVRKRFEHGGQIVVALIYIVKDAHPIFASTGADWGNYWDCYDLHKATRSIRRHNKDCLIIDRRDFIFETVDDLAGFDGIH